MTNIDVLRIEDKVLRLFTEEQYNVIVREFIFTILPMYQLIVYDK